MAKRLASFDSVSLSSGNGEERVTAPKKKSKVVKSGIHQQSNLEAGDLADTYGKGFAMLVAMGYKQGASLGKRGDGLQAPLEAKPHHQRNGLQTALERLHVAPSTNPEMDSATEMVVTKLLLSQPLQLHGPAQASALQWHGSLEQKWGEYRAFLERTKRFVIVGCPGGTFCAFPRFGLTGEWAVALDEWFTKREQTASKKQQNKWRQAGNAAKKHFMEAFGKSSDHDEVDVADVAKPIVAENRLLGLNPS